MTTSQTQSLIQVNAGTVLIREGELSRKMFIIKTGKVRVFKNYMNQRITLAILGEGEVFGELSFFDAEKRSASVEALTNITALIVDGDAASEQIAALPDWVVPIFRTVFYRFREADAKITVLQSMNEFQKKSFKTDTVGQTIYVELLRFLKTLEMICERAGKGGIAPASALVMQELDEVLGKRFIGLKVFWRLLKEYDIMDHHLEEKEGKISLNKKSMEAWKTYLASEVATERYLVLGHPAIALLRRIVGLINSAHGEKSDTQGNRVKIKFDDIRVDTLPLHEDAIAELTGKKLLTVVDNSFLIDSDAICNLYLFQSILKNFDHTIIALD